MPRKQISKKNNKNRKLKKKNKHSKKKTKTEKKVINRKIKTRKNKKKYLDRNKQVGGVDYSDKQKQDLIEKHIKGFETVFADQIKLIDDIKFNLCYLRNKNQRDFDILIEQLKYGTPFYNSLINDGELSINPDPLNKIFESFLAQGESVINQGLSQNIIRETFKIYCDAFEFEIKFKLRGQTKIQSEISLEIIIKPEVPNQDLLEELCAILLGNTVFWYVIQDNFVPDRDCSQILKDSQSQSQNNYSASQESQGSQGSIVIGLGDSQDNQATQIASQSSIVIGFEDSQATLSPSQSSQGSYVNDIGSSQQFILDQDKLQKEKERIKELLSEGGSQTLTYHFLEKKYDKDLTQELITDMEEETHPPDSP